MLHPFISQALKRQAGRPSFWQSFFTLSMLVSCIGGSCLKLEAILWAGVATATYLDISTAFRWEPDKRRTRPKAELQRCHDQASAQKGPRFR